MSTLKSGHYWIKAEASFDSEIAELINGKWFTGAGSKDALDKEPFLIEQYITRPEENIDVTPEMIAAGMKEWDRLMNSGVREWPKVLSSTFEAMLKKCAEQKVLPF